MITETKNDKNWKADDELSSEHELADLLYGLVRMEKPAVVLETGTYQGHATRALSGALALNERGFRLVTCDTHNYNRSLGRAEFIQAPSLDVIAGLDGVQMAFLDSDFERLDETMALWPKLARQSIVVIQGMHNPRNQMGAEYLMDKATNLQLLEFDTVRGLVVMRLFK